VSPSPDMGIITEFCGGGAVASVLENATNQLFSSYRGSGIAGWETKRRGACLSYDVPAAESR
jgi:hypothetical protein